MKLKFAVIMLITFFLLTPSHAKIMLYDNCEGDYHNNWRDQGMTGTNLISSYSTTHKLSGDYSYKIHQTACPAGAGSCTGGAQTNCELITIKNTTPNIINFETDQEYWISWNTYFPADFPAPVGFGLQGQFHGAFDEACSNAVQVTLWGLYFIGATSQTTACKYQDGACDVTAKNCTNFGDVSSPLPVVRGAWNSTVMHFKVNWNGSGLLQVWRNGTRYVNYTGSFGFNDSPKGPYFKLGLYGHWGVDLDIWVDEIRIGDQDENYTSMLGGVPSNISPTVAIDSPVGNQSIAVNDSLNFTCTAADSDGTIASYLWDFDDSGIAQSLLEDPGSKQFTVEGTYTVRVTVTDNDGATASATVNVVVGSATITGLINNHLIESGAILTDDEANENLVDHGTITIESVASEFNPPGLGTHGTAVLDGSTQYFTMANWDASNPWQSAHPGGTFIIGLKTPAAYPGGLKKYLFGSYDIGADERIIQLVLDSADFEPQLLIGVNSGASYEQKLLGSSLAPDSQYVLFFTTDGSSKTWNMQVYDVGATGWLTGASGTISGTMNYTGTSPWTIGCRLDGGSPVADTFFAGQIYFDQIYNTVMTTEEMHQFIGEGYTPPAGTFGIVSTCLTKQGSSVCIDGDALLTVNDVLQMKVVFDKAAFGKSTTANPGSNFALTYPLDTGSMVLQPCGGNGGDTWFFCGKVASGMYEYSNVELSAVSDLDRDYATPGTNATITDESGTEIVSYNFPQVGVDPTYNVRIFSGPGMFHKKSE